MSKNIKYFEKIIKTNFYEKYKIDVETFNNYIIENIIFNEKSHLVATFKDELIMNDDFEFLKRFYTYNESNKRLFKYINYYEKYNFLFPNYTILSESNYLYQNINRKQRILDEQQIDKNAQVIINEKKNSKNNKDNNSPKDSNNGSLVNKSNIIFNSKVYDSILKSANNSCFSQFGIDKNKDLIDSIVDIQEIIRKINFNQEDLYNIVKLDDSPAHFMNNNNVNINDINETKEKIINDIGNRKILNTNYCYNKFKNRDIKSLLFYKTNQNLSNTNTPMSNNKISFFSPLYTKVNIRQNNLFNNPINNNIEQNNNIKIEDENNKIVNNKNIKTNTNNQNTNNKNQFIYRKLSPINRFSKISFSIQKDIINKEFLKTIDYFPSTTKSAINPVETKKKNSLKINYYFNDSNLLNGINFSTKNKINNNKNLYINNAKIMNKKILYSKRRANSELNDNLKNNINNIKFQQKENTLNIHNNNCLKEKSNIIKNNKNNTKTNKMRNIKYGLKLNNIQYRTKSLSNNKNTINNRVKPYITDSLIDSISNKIKKENQNYISKRIYNLIKSNKKNSNLNKLKKNKISLKKHFQFANKTQNNNSLNLVKNKLITSLDKNFTKDTFSFTFNSNISNNIIHINKIPTTNAKKKYIYLNPTPNSIKKHISFKQYINNNFATINNTYNCQFFSPKSDIKKANNTLYLTKNNIPKLIGNCMKKNKYVYDTSNMNNKKKIYKMNTVSALNNNKLAINANKKKKILIIRKKENNTKNNYNKNIININNTKTNKIKNKGINNTLKIQEFEKIKLIEPGQTFFTSENLKNKYKILLKQ